MSPPLPDYSTLVAEYRNEADVNDALWQQFQDATGSDPLLSAHRQHVEAHKLGFGDAAFHSMWSVLLDEAVKRFEIPRVLEIGIFKGQVISLWALIAQQRGYHLNISAVGPLAGDPAPSRSLWNRLRAKVDSGFRERLKNGDFYAAEDYERIVRDHFSHHGLSFDSVRLYRGFSTDPMILEQLRDEKFHLVYVDGAHTYEGAKSDFLNFGPKVVPGGWVVADDASSDLPGSLFWKGHPAVSRAVKSLDDIGFRNVVNIGHNRVFERT